MENPSPSGVITLDEEITYKPLRSDTYVLLPGQFILATTMEYFILPNDLTAFVEPVAPRWPWYLPR